MFSEGASTTRSVQEGPADRAVGTPLTATDPEGGTLTYSLNGPDAMSFMLSDSQLTTKDPLDYEASPTKRTYKVTVVATDRGGLSDSIDVTITVDDIEELPMFPADVPTSNLYVYEGKIGAEVFDPDGALMATDGDKDTLTYTHSGTDLASFNINSRTGKLTTVAALDYEADPPQLTYTVTVTATDTTDSFDTITVTIHLKDITEEDNEGPVFVDSNDDPITRTSFAVVENSEDLFVGLVEAPDANGDEVTYTLSGRDARYFTIGATTGELSSKEEPPLDFDTRPRGYTVTITATDGQEEDTITVTITITDVNESPMFVDANNNPISSTTLEVKEGTGVRDIDMVLATDPDGDPLTYTLDTASDALFSIVRTSTGGQLKTRVALDFEDPPTSYTVEVSVSDNKDDEGVPDTEVDDRITVTVRVTNVNEVPMFLDASDNSITVDTRTVKEKQAGGTAVGAPVVATDPENDALKYTLGGTDAGSFNIGETDGQLTTKDALAAGTKRVIVRVSDSKNAAGDADTIDDDQITVTITIEAVETTNNAPAFLATETGARSIPEGETGQPVGAPVTATDADDDTLTYTLGDVPGSTDAASFDIDSATGQLTTNVALDYEPEEGKPAKRTYTVTVTAKDDADKPFADTITVTITITDVNETPTFPDATNMLYVYEGDAGQKVIDPDEELTATDPEKGTLTYTLLTGTGSFNINSGTGQLTTVAALNYEAVPAKLTYTVTVRVSDGTNTARTTVEIALKDVTEADNNQPRFIASATTDDTAITSITRTVPENAGDDMTLDRDVGAVILATDDDSSDTLSYTLGWC